MLDELQEELAAALRASMMMSAGKVPGKHSGPHIPKRCWQERARTITWACSCGCVNKHVPLPAILRCVDDKED